MHFLKQIAAVTRLNLRSLPLRLGASSVIVIGIAGVVGVLVSILAMVAGLSQMMSSNGRPDRAIVISTGSSFEVLSNLSRAATWTIKNAPGIRRGADGKALASAEALAVVRGVLQDGSPANLSLRGTGPEFLQVRPELRIVEGRAFEPAVRELIVGRSAQRQFRGLELGSRITLRGADWTVVGVFESGGDRFESGADHRRRDAAIGFPAQHIPVGVGTARLCGIVRRLQCILAPEPSLSVDVLRETDYARAAIAVLHPGAHDRRLSRRWHHGARGRVRRAQLDAHGGEQPHRRDRHAASAGVRLDIRRGLGVRRGVAAGRCWAGLLGACLAWLIFDGHVMSTSGAGATQLAVPLVVGPRIIVLGVLLACIIGMIGACLPAVHAARTPLAAALRGS